MSWKRYYKLVKRSSEVEDRRKKENRAFVVQLCRSSGSRHWKTRIMLEHFVSQTKRKIQGNSQSNVSNQKPFTPCATKRKFDEIMREMNPPYIRSVGIQRNRNGSRK